MDVVAHSLGGLIARSYSQRATSNSDSFANSENYKKGYFHKLITIGTPHRGSPLGPELYNNRIKLVYFPPEVLPMTFEDWMAARKLPIGSVHADFGKASPGMNALKQTLPFKSFSIVGDFTGQNTANALMSSITSIGLNKSLDQIMSSVCLGDGTLKHDLIVPLSSQKGFLNDNEGRFEVFRNVIHMAQLGVDAETSSNAVKDRVAQLLLSNDLTEFGKGYPAPSSLPMDACDMPNQRQKGAASDIPSTRIAYSNQYIKIISPLKGSIFNKDNSVSLTLTFEARNGAVPETAMFMVDGIGWIQAPTTSPYTVNFQLPANCSLGKVGVAAIVRDSSGLLLADESSILITTSRGVDSLSVNPPRIALDSSLRQATVYVKGYFGRAGSIETQDLTMGSTGTIYNTRFTNIVKVSPDGLITAVGSGVDTLIVSNSGKSKKIPVTVSSTFRQAKLYPNTINFPSIPDHIVGDSPFGITANASSADPVMLSIVSGPARIQNGILDITGPGRVTVKASQGGNAYFVRALDVLQSFCVMQQQPSISESNNVLISSSTIGNQWFLNNVPIDEAIDPTYVPTVSGNYSVRVTLDGCASDLSKEVSFVVTSINDPFFGNKVSIYPNPFDEKFLVLNSTGESLQIELVDLLGKQILADVISSGVNEFNLINVAAGLYIIQVSLLNNNTSVRRSILLKR